jgi:hypothetical protein
LNSGGHQTLKYYRISCLAVLPFFVPCHLDGFELLLVGVLGIVAESFKSRDPLVQIGKPDRQGSMSGYLSAKAIAISSVLIQVNPVIRFPSRACL